MGKIACSQSFVVTGRGKSSSNKICSGTIGIAASFVITLIMSSMIVVPSFNGSFCFSRPVPTVVGS